MKVVRTAALSRHEAPQFAFLTDEEIIALRLVPAWMRWLFLELVAMSNFKTGVIYTSYARLASLLDCDQPERGKRLDVPTIKQIRSALDTFNTMGLALRDRAGNEEKRELKILVNPRVSEAAPAEKKGREKGRHQNGYNYDEHGPQRKPDTQIGQRTGQGVQKPNTLLPPPLHVDNLSTGVGPEKTSQQAPPGGQSLAPAGHAPGLTELGDGWRFGPPTPDRAAFVEYQDPTTWRRDERGRLIPPMGHPIARRIRGDP